VVLNIIRIDQRVHNNLTNARGDNAAIADGAILRPRMAVMTKGRIFMSELSSPGQVVRPMVLNALKAATARGPSGCNAINVRIESMMLLTVGVIS
jgi:hypothetical protein